jgi:hypothetical protein
MEEAGLTADLWLCGTVIVDAGDVGVCLFVVAGENAQGEIQGSMEGTPEWVPYEAVLRLPVVEDLPFLLEKIHSMTRGDPPFSARSYYADEKLNIEFV